MNFSVLDFFKFASRMPQIVQILVSTFKIVHGGRNSSLVMFGLDVHSVAGSILFWGREDFSLGVNMGSNSIPPKTLSDESIYKPRSSLCTHAFHRTDSKDPDVHVLDG